MDSPRLLLIFDIDGTLTESCAVDADCFVQAMVEVLGISGIDTNWERYTHVTDSGIAREISSTMRGCPLSESEESALEAAHFRHLTNLAPESLPPVSGAIEFLDMLGRDGRVRLAIATGCWKRSAHWKLRAAGIHPDAFTMATASEAVSREDILALSRQRAGVPPGIPTVYFGDGVWDLKTANALGWEFVGIGRRAKDLRRLGARYAFHDYSNKGDILRCLFGGETET